MSGRKTCLGNTFKGDAGESNEITTTRVHKYQRSPQEPSFVSGHPSISMSGVTTARDDQGLRGWSLLQSRSADYETYLSNRNQRNELDRSSSISKYI